MPEVWGWTERSRPHWLGEHAPLVFLKRKGKCRTLTTATRLLADVAIREALDTVQPQPTFDELCYSLNRMFYKNVKLSESRRQVYADPTRVEMLEAIWVDISLSPEALGGKAGLASCATLCLVVEAKACLVQAGGGTGKARMRHGATARAKAREEQGPVQLSKPSEGPVCPEAEEKPRRRPKKQGAHDSGGGSLQARCSLAARSLLARCTLAGEKKGLAAPRLAAPCTLAP